MKLFPTSQIFMRHVDGMIGPLKRFNSSGLSALGNIGLTHAIFFVNIGNGIILEKMVKIKYRKNDTVFNTLILTPNILPHFFYPLKCPIAPPSG